MVCIIAVIVSGLILLIENESFKREITKSEPYIALGFTIYISILTLLVVILKRKPDVNK